MKRLILNKLNYSDATILNRSQMKKVLGGDEPATDGGLQKCKPTTQACTFTDENGNTSNGYCNGKGDTSGVPYGTITMTCYCHTPSHTNPTELGSNNSVSRCVDTR